MKAATSAGSRVAGLMVCALVCSACTDTVPARIEVPQDTVVVNSTIWTSIGVRVLNKRGAVIERPLVSYSAVPESLLAVSRSGAVNCHDDGTGVIMVRAEKVHARVPIRCEVVHRFSGPTAAYLIAGGAPVPLEIQAYDGHDRLMPRVRLQLFIRDTTVIALRDGMVYGLKPGATVISVYSWSRAGGEIFWVRAPPPMKDSVAPPHGRARAQTPALRR